MENEQLLKVASQFIPQNEIGQVVPLGEGFINDTFLVHPIDPTHAKYLLQRKNKAIFPDIPAMMDNILKVTNHLKQKIREKGGDPQRESMTIIAASDGQYYYRDENQDFWTVCLFIEDHLVYDKVDSPRIAYSGGKGIGRFQAMLSDFHEKLADTLPGFHNMRHRFGQWDEVLKNDPAGRKHLVLEEIGWVEGRREEMMAFWTLVENGTIPKRVTHNDTKISNILFDKQAEVLCMIDLDTVLQSPVLNDFGDAIRSYANTAAEDEPKLDLVSLDLQLYSEFARGYLEEARPFLTQTEVNYLAFSARLITFEQVLRFLMDYLYGDRYYKIKYPDHNLVRTHAQFRLLQSMEDQFDEMNNIVLKIFTNDLVSLNDKEHSG